MVRFIATTETEEAAARTARGDHALLFEAEDCHSLLAQAQPNMVFGPTTAAQPLPNVTYGDFVELVLCCAKADEQAHGRIKLDVSMLGDGCIDRIWKQVLKGTTPETWTPCSKGAFKARLRAAARSSAVDASELVLTAADFYTVLARALAPILYLRIRDC